MKRNKNGVVWADKELKFQARITKKRNGDSYLVTLSSYQESFIPPSTILASASHARKEVALAIAVGFMETASKLEKKYVTSEE